MAAPSALKMSNWVQKDAAELLSISPRVMNYKIKTLSASSSRAAVAHNWQSQPRPVEPMVISTSSDAF